MHYKMSNHQLALVLIIIGAVFRIWLGAINPPDNTYDEHHHQKVVKLYAEDMSKPLPSECWQCYQPPLFYTVSAILWHAGDLLSLTAPMKWKVVQGINTTASVATLILLLLLLKSLGVESKIRLSILSLAVFLPRDIFSSAMLTNDYLLVFFTTASALIFVKSAKLITSKNCLNYRQISLLAVFVVFGSLTKQHGLLLTILPISLWLIYLRFNAWHISFRLSLVVITTLIIAGMNEIWLFLKSGHFLVSNQHFFSLAKGQPPGSLSSVEFFTFRFFKLLKEPFIDKATFVSLPSQLFARLWFDYEWRFLHPEMPHIKLFGRVIYWLGLGYLISFLGSMVVAGIKTFKLVTHQLSKTSVYHILPLAIVGVLYLLVPVVQTIRFPYYSSMKAIFYLPAMP